MSKHKGLHFSKQKKKINPIIFKEIFSWIFGIITSIFIAGVMVYFLGMSTDVVGISMEPTLYHGQNIFVNRFAYTLSSPKKGDVIVFLPNGNKNSHYYVKRVIARPGDTVKIDNGICYVNGEECSFITSKILDAGIAENEFKIESGKYFCIGDNPNNSEDSRSANIGAVDEKDIIGKVWFRAKIHEESMGFVK